MRADGNCTAGGPANVRGLPIPIEPRPTGRTTASDLERAHTPAWRIPTVDAPTAPANQPEQQCTACREHVHTVSTRGWCDWCEQQAALAIAPSNEVPNRQAPEPEEPTVHNDDEQPVELPDYILEFAILMRDTEAHDDPIVRAARKVVANAAVKLQQAHRTWLGRQRTAAQPKGTPRPQRPPAKRGPKIDQAVVDACIRLYTGEQLTIPKIADRLHLGTATVRRHLLAKGIELRDDRAGHTGGANKRVDDPAFVRQVADLYVAGRSMAEIQARLSTGQSQVRKALAAAGVDVRPALARQPADHAAALRERMTAAGITAKQVRTWARATGLDVPAVGLLPARIVDAYLDQHRTNNSQEMTA